MLLQGASRAQVLGVKLSVGAVAIVLVAAIPLGIYTLWAAAPATHASPFYWSMCVWAWLNVFEIPLVYLAAFLSGLRPGAWLGSRLLPLVAALFALLTLIAHDSPIVFVALVAVQALFVAIIFSIAVTRDFS